MRSAEVPPANNFVARLNLKRHYEDHEGNGFGTAVGLVLFAAIRAAQHIANKYDSLVHAQRALHIDRLISPPESQNPPHHVK
jgi:hypothetical protein